jgi:archaellum component FlaC
LQILASVKAELQETTDLYEQRSQDILAHRSRQELARHVEDLVAEVRKEREARERAGSELTNADGAHDAELRRGRRALEAKE